MTKFNDEELSRILTAHANGGLIRGGSDNSLAYPGCIVQIASLETELNSNCLFYNPWPTAWWFDSHYNPDWTVEEFLEKLVEKGFV